MRIIFVTHYFPPAIGTPQVRLFSCIGAGWLLGRLKDAQLAVEIWDLWTAIFTLLGPVLRLTRIGEVLTCDDVSALTEALRRALGRLGDSEVSEQVRRHVAQYSIDIGAVGFEQAA